MWLFIPALPTGVLKRPISYQAYMNTVVDKLDEPYQAQHSAPNSTTTTGSTAAGSKPVLETHNGNVYYSNVYYSSHKANLILNPGRSLVLLALLGVGYPTEMPS